MAKPQKPLDAYVVNGWYLQIPVPGLLSDAIFETLDGVQKQAGSVQIVDAGTNRKFNFSDQMMDFGEMTLTRTYQGNEADRAMETLVTTMISEGLKLPIRAVKMHNGREVFTVVFENFRFMSEQHPTWDIAGTDKYTVTYTATCDGWYILPAGL